MHSLAQRASSLSSLTTSALFFVLILVSVLTWVTPQGNINPLRFNSAKPIVSLKNTRNYGATKSNPKENARFKFDLVADFSNIVDWNTKQIFVYVYVELDDVPETSSSSSSSSLSDQSNKLVIWDKILTDKNNMYINYKNLKSKYSIWDYKSELNGRKGQFKLGYNIQPHVGPLTLAEIDLNKTFVFPEVYRV
jgi:signal peptidase complex subunit 3